MKRSDPSIYSMVEDGIVLTLHIQPRASKNEVCGIQNNAVKIRLTSPPVDGAANKLCKEYLADLFHVSKSCVEIISGETSRHKRVKISSPEPGKLQLAIDRIIENI